MYIPRGKWYNFWTDEVVNGGKEMWVDADLDTIPIFNHYSHVVATNSFFDAGEVQDTTGAQ